MVVIASVGSVVRVKLVVAVSGVAVLSVTLRAKVAVPAAVGVPESVAMPLVTDRAIPAGSEPDSMLQLYGVMPFWARTLAL